MRKLGVVHSTHRAGNQVEREDPYVLISFTENEYIELMRLVDGMGNHQASISYTPEMIDITDRLKELSKYTRSLDNAKLLVSNIQDFINEMSKESQGDE